MWTNLKIHALCLTLIIHISFAVNQPNIVLIVTDDQDIVLDGMEPLQKTKQLIIDKGVTFSNAYCTTPICCPSRSSILTGKYMHNTKTVNNSVSGGCSSQEWRDQMEPLGFARYIHDAGYSTFYAGKYLNEYGYKRGGGVAHVPPGWDWWIGLVGNSVYYNYSLSINGSEIKHGDKEADYLTDVLRNHALNFLSNKPLEKPYLLVVNTPSAHAPFTPAPKYANRFNSTLAPRTPHFNTGTDGKHWLLRLPPKILPQKTLDEIDEVFRGRWGTLLSVDDLVEDLFKKVEENGEIDNTYFIYTSDHGFHMGQFALPWDKRQPYEFDIRIPMYVRGPSINKKTVPNPVLTIDIAPTLLDIAGIPPPGDMDGESFLSFLQNNISSNFNRSFLIEYQGESSYTTARLDNCYNDLNLTLCLEQVSCKCQDVKNNTFTCYKRMTEKIDEIYCFFEDDENFQEKYDLKTDPYQLINLYSLTKVGQPEELKYNSVHQCYQQYKQLQINDIAFSIDDCLSLLQV